MITRQEMFDRAWRGLKAQGWAVCADQHGDCIYFDRDTGNRCAWGHVDPIGTQARPDAGSVRTLHSLGVGLADELDDEDLQFAADLQVTHDLSSDGRDLEESMRSFANCHGLTIPDEAP